jgi:hypothetical protein
MLMRYRKLPENQRFVYLAMHSPARAAKYPGDKFPPLGPGIVVIKSKTLTRNKGVVEWFSTILNRNESYHELRIDKASGCPQVAAWPDESVAKSKVAPSSSFFLNKPSSNVFVRDRTHLVIIHASKEPKGFNHINDEIILDFPTSNECYEWEAAVAHAVTMHIFPELTSRRVIVSGAALINFLQIDAFEPSEHVFELKLDDYHHVQLVQLGSATHAQRIFMLNGADWESDIGIGHPHDAGRRHSTEDHGDFLFIKNARHVDQVEVDIILEFTADTWDSKRERTELWKQAIKYAMDLFEDQDPDSQLRNQLRATTQLSRQKKLPVVVLNDSIFDDEHPVQQQQHERKEQELLEQQRQHRQEQQHQMNDEDEPPPSQHQQQQQHQQVEEEERKERELLEQQIRQQEEEERKEQELREQLDQQRQQRQKQQHQMNDEDEPPPPSQHQQQLLLHQQEEEMKERELLEQQQQMNYEDEPPQPSQHQQQQQQQHQQGEEQEEEMKERELLEQQQRRQQLEMIEEDKTQRRQEEVQEQETNVDDGEDNSEQLEQHRLQEHAQQQEQDRQLTGQAFAPITSAVATDWSEFDKPPTANELSLSQMKIFFTFLFGFFIGLLLLGPSITGFLERLHLISKTLCLLPIDFPGVCQYGTLESCVSPSLILSKISPLNLTSISSVVTLQVAR